MLNYEMFEIPCHKYYLPIVLLDVREHKLVCQEVNSLLILMRNPRPNIDLVSEKIQFYFETENGDSSLGQVESNITFFYNIDNPKQKTKEKCMFFFEGFHLTEILFYFPYIPHQRFLMDIRFFNHEKRDGKCRICFEETTLVNLHNNMFRHEVCKNCLYRISQCPFCRKEF